MRICVLGSRFHWQSSHKTNKQRGLAKEVGHDDLGSARPWPWRKRDGLEQRQGILQVIPFPLDFFVIEGVFFARWLETRRPAVTATLWKNRLQWRTFLWSWVGQENRCTLNCWARNTRLQFWKQLRLRLNQRETSLKVVPVFFSLSGQREKQQD